jgi:fatty acid desaturase
MAAHGAVTTANLAIPVRANLLIGALAVAVSAACLWVASHAASWWAVAAACVLFSYANNTIFSLHHEAVHHNFHPDPRLNDAAGVLLAGFFPTIFSAQRISHFGHHRRNRTDEELYDYVLPHQSWWLKTYWIYCLLTGFYWAIIPVAMTLYLLCPWAFRARWFQDGPARWWGFRPFVMDIARAPIGRVWREGIASLALQLALVTALDLSLTGWLLCYWAFGLNWSSVQYSDHAGSPRDVIEGAWNLRFWPGAQWAFLNYNFHLAHHRRPDVPWIHLPRFVRPDDPRPSFWSIYLRLWLGAQPAPPGPGPRALDELQT